MDKILSFIINEDKKLLLLKGSSNDPQFKKSFWYVVTGGCEEYETKKDTVIREIKEETGIYEVKKILYLNWIFQYNSLGKECTEYVYITFVNSNQIILSEEHIDYKWCDLKEFIEQINWFGDKEELKKVLELAIKKQVYFKKDKLTRY